MAVVTAPSLSLRDFIQRILPTVIAVCLFVPFFPGVARRMTLEGLIIGAVILGYLTAEPLYATLLWPVTRRLPLVGGELKKHGRERRWVATNWDFDRLLFSLSKDDSESLYVNYSYVEFYHRVGSLLLIYAFVNLGWLAASVVNWPEAGDPVWERVVFAATPMLGDWRVSSLLVAALALLVSYTSFKQFLLIYQEVFLRQGQFDVLARLYHEKEGSVAQSIWGSVSRDGAPAAEVEVRLLSADDAVLARTLTDEEGRFQFAGWYKKCPTARRKLLALAPDWQMEMSARLGRKRVPCYDLESSGSRPLGVEIETA